jgi:hypothetical protein
MRTIDQRSISKMTSGEFGAWLLLRMELDDTVFTMTDSDIPLRHSGELYLPYAFDLDPVKYSSSTVVDLLTIRISDVEDSLKGSFVGGTANGSAVTLKLYVDIDLKGLAADQTGASFGPSVHGVCMANGFAFIRVEGVDLAAFAGSPGYTPYKLILTDSSGKKAVGWIAEGDSEETLGDELLQNPGFETYTGTYDDGVSDNFTNWTETNDDAHGSKTEATATFHDGVRAVKLSKGSVTAGNVYQRPTATAGKLYKVVFYTRGNLGKAGRYRIYDNDIGTIVGIVTTGVTGDSYAEIARYATASAGATALGVQLYAGSGVGDIAYFDDASIKEVTHVGADGVHIVSAQNGSTRNWESIESGFNYNDSSYTFQVIPAKQSDLAVFPIFIGSIDGWNVDESDLQMYVANDMSNWNQRPLNKHGASCRWKKFKGNNSASPCHYSGYESWCDRSYSRCMALGNSANFGGFRWLPSLETKEIFWGHKFGEA